jgi:hypothetical protein
VGPDLLGEGELGWIKFADNGGHATMHLGRRVSEAM